MSGGDRENLYRALSGENNPSLITIARVAAALGIRFRAEPIPERVASKLAPTAET